MIVDSSFQLLLAIPEDLAGSAAPDELRDLLVRISRREPLIAPTMLACEVGHVIHRKRRRVIGGTLLGRQTLVEALVRGLELWPPTAQTLRRAGELSETSGMSFYDAQFLAQAQELGSSLLTADRGLCAHARASRIRCYLFPKDLERLSADYPISLRAS